MGPKKKKKSLVVCIGSLGVLGGCWAWVLSMIVVGAAGLGAAHLNTERTVPWVSEDGDLPGLEPDMPGCAGGLSIKLAVGNVRQVSKKNGKLI